ncbi:MAG TPA: glycoside hydrolase family 3 N-terminal domain-containing protein, partial [Bacteroidales bacterium]|nr:glycoside hydrolase family 3 N-terminal domain-containing protein [Bacteroidales bacterium]
KISKVPLLISMDAEWGLGMRLDNIEKFPFQMTLGAIKDDSLIYKMGKGVADQCRRLGVHINLAPVADINNNALNPVINYRSFGENRENVTSKALMYVRGMQDNGVLATVKHFPGHGDTSVDSHYDLPVITHPASRLDSVEIFPFLNLINEGAGAVMTAHLSLPSLDPASSLPSTLSPVIINDLLKTRLGFKGLVVTDAMNMKGVTKYFGPGEADARALAAGNDVIEFVTDVDAAIREIRNYINTKKLSAEEISLKCRKVLAVKYWAGLSRNEPVTIKNITEDISSTRLKALIRELYSNSITVLNNNGEIIPVKNLQSIKIATLAINRNELTTFQQRISDYFPADHFFADPAQAGSLPELMNRLAGYDLVIAGIFRTDQRPQTGYGIKPEMLDLLLNLTGLTRTIVTYFGNPYAINRLEPVWKSEGLVLAYQENEYTEDLAAQLIFGGIGAKGTLPVTINHRLPSGYGIQTTGNIRLQYGIPESAGMSSEFLNRKIDSIALSGIQAGAYPGCQVMAARNGIVVFHKTYGYHTYENRIRIEKTDIFDLASVTKVSATLPGLMLLNSQGRFSPDQTLGYYLDEFRHSDKKDLLMRDLLTHQAGLTAWIPFWRETVRRDDNLKRSVFRLEPSTRFEEKVADHLYINNNYRNRIFREIKKSPLGEKRYVYSDLTFIISPEIIERLAGEAWHGFVTKNIYHKIGAFDIGFNPYQRYPFSRIVPTEYDSLFRRQLLHGTVHDEGAAMLGGISGHAGLFATANDLMKLMELYRRMGSYGGEQIIAEEILREYSRVQFPENKNRRGLGFDKPLLDNADLPQEKTYPTKGASTESFGHSGYTGTFVWIDPVHNISYVFFSNRVYPTRNNNLLSDLNIRTNILQALYDSVEGNRRSKRSEDSASAE